MEIREDICFTYKDSNKKLYASKEPDFLFFHPKKVEENIEKFEKHLKRNTPEFYGEIEPEKVFVMIDKGGIICLNHDMVDTGLSLSAHFNGKILIVPKITEMGYTIKNNCRQILCKSAKKIVDKDRYSIYKAEDTPIHIVITKGGYIHPYSNLDSEILPLGPGFCHHIKTNSSAYILYDENGRILGIRNSKKELEEILTDLNKKQKHIQNPLEEKREELYRKYLYAIFKKTIYVEEQTEEHFIKTMTKALEQNEKEYVFNLVQNWMHEGKMSDCLELKSGDSSCWINNLHDIENATEDYKRKLEIKKNI